MYSIYTFFASILVYLVVNIYILLLVLMILIHFFIIVVGLDISIFVIAVNLFCYFFFASFWALLFVVLDTEH